MRYAIISDIHANLAAIEAVHEDVKEIRKQDRILGRARTEYWFLGDIVGYGGDAQSCVKWLRTKADIENRWVAGNHDEYCASIISTQISSEISAKDLDTQAFQTLSAHKIQLQDASRETNFLLNGVGANSLCEELCDDLCLVFTHAATSEEQHRSEYVFPWGKTKLAIEFENIEKRHSRKKKQTVVFCGHTHFPMWVAGSSSNAQDLFSIRYGVELPITERLNLINPGSVGQPRDGDPRASYLILDTVKKTLEFRRVEYDVEAAIQSIDKLPNVDFEIANKLIERLRTADGAGNMSNYFGVYRRPKWDLEAVNRK